MSQSVGQIGRELCRTVFLAALSMVPGLLQANGAGNEDSSVSSNAVLGSTFPRSTSQIIKEIAPKGIRETYYACIDKARSDLRDVGACITAEKHYQDERLNKAYKKLLNSLKDQSKNDLVVAERSWLAFKEKDSEFLSTLYGDDPVDSMQLAQDEVFRLCERANVLETYLDLAQDS